MRLTHLREDRRAAIRGRRGTPGAPSCSSRRDRRSTAPWARRRSGSTGRSTAAGPRCRGRVAATRSSPSLPRGSGPGAPRRAPRHDRAPTRTCIPDGPDRWRAWSVPWRRRRPRSRRGARRLARRAPPGASPVPEGSGARGDAPRTRRAPRPALRRTAIGRRPWRGAAAHARSRTARAQTATARTATAQMAGGRGSRRP